MPLFSEHISNMYYSGTPSYSNPYSSYSSSLSPLGSSYSASYLNPGGSYSSHSSLSSYSRAPLTSRWIPGMSRNYSPMLTPISERGTSSPVRINSPRRIPISKRSYGTSGYTQRPININTADIDVSRDRYRRKPFDLSAPVTKPPPEKESINDEKDKSPFMPRVDGKPETGIDSSPGLQRNTIKRGRTVVRLHTVKRKERDSPRKPVETVGPQDSIQNASVENAVENLENSAEVVNESSEAKSWREKLSEDLIYTEKREKKSLGTKFVETFIVKDANDEANKIKGSDIIPEDSAVTVQPNSNIPVTNKLSDRRCSMELLAEQANVLDSLIRSENLSVATLDLSKVGVDEESKPNAETVKRKNSGNKKNPLTTTKSDQSLHENFKLLRNSKDSKTFSKRRSLKKSSSGGSICRLDSITEFPKDIVNIEFPAIEESRTSTKLDMTEVKPKPKLKTKITASVEISPPASPLKFKIENVTVEEKINLPKKEITFSSTVEDPIHDITLQSPIRRTKERHSIKKKNKTANDSTSPESEDCNFWDKIGKRETVYLVKRKQNLDELKEKHKRALFWFPENEDTEITNATDITEIRKNDVSSDTYLTSISPLSELNLSQELNDDMKVNSELSNTIISEIINDGTVIKTSCTSNDIEQKMETDHIIINEISANLTKTVNEQTDLQSIAEPQERLPMCKKSELPAYIKEIPQELTSVLEVSGLESKILESNQLQEVITNNFEETLLSSEKRNSDVANLIDEPKKYPSSSTVKELSKNINIQLDVVGNPDLLVTENEVCNTIQRDTEVVETKLDVVENQIFSEDNDNVSNPIQNDNGKLSQCDDKRDIIQDTALAKIVKESKKTSLVEDILLPLPQNEERYTVLNIEKEPFSKENIKVFENQQNMQVSENLDASTIVSNRLEEMDKCNVLISSKDKEYEVDPITPTYIISKETPNKTNDCIESKTSIIKVKKPVDVPKKLKSKTEPKISNKTAGLKTATASSSPKLKNVKAVQKCPIHSVDNKTEKRSSKNSEQINSSPTALPQSKIPSETNNTSHDMATMKTDRPTPSSESLNDESSAIISQIPKEIESQNIPKITSQNDLDNVQIKVETEKKTEENKADSKMEESTTNLNQRLSLNAVTTQTLSAKKPVKEEKAVKPLIATPRPLQKRAPQVINSSDSSDSDDDSSDEEEESDASEDSAEFFACENNGDGRTSTGSNDSGFDSSAPTSPATFLQIKKDCDVNCHRKCEKLTANLCGVNQRLLVEALATRTASKKGTDSPAPSSSNAAAPLPATDILEQELEQSTAYGIFRKTGRFTPPARSIPRFRKYTIEDFQFIKVLGKGSFGKVLLAELRDTEYYYAVKCLKKDVVLEDDDVECTLIERKVLALGTNHPYLCHLFATFQTDSHLFFVMEYLNGGDLMFHIQQSGRFPEARARFYAAEIVSGLKFLHKRGIVYRDLKLDNILLDFDGHVRIADFGMCKLQIYLEKTADTFCGTPDYMAPEIIKGLKYNQTVDWWSFGVLLYEMLIGQSPFSGCDEDELFWSICNEMPSYPRFLSQEALTILTRLLDKDARTRLGGVECMHGDIREQDFFHHVHWDRLERRELEAPFRPRVRHPLDTQYFDRAFTGERPRLTAVEPHVLRSMDQEPFRGFSYTNPNATDR